MRGREFLGPARAAVGRGTEADWRTAAVNAYYALFLECREALTGWGVVLPRHLNVHSAVRLKFSYARHKDLNDIAIVLERLGILRNHAKYNLRPGAEFATSKKAHLSIKDSADTIALLDAVEADPARRAAAAASLPP